MQKQTLKRLSSNGHSQSDSTEMTLETIKVYWQEACALTNDLYPEQLFSTPEAVEYINKHLPPGSEPLTKTKVNYLRAQGILKPVEHGEGEKRTSWRYGPNDVRRVLTVELLKTRADLSVQEIKGWLRIFDETQSGGILVTKDHSPSRKGIPAPPPPASLAYSLLHSRTLGTIITAIGRRDAEIIPEDCLIAIRVLDRLLETPRPRKLPSWEETRELLSSGSWYLAATHHYLKLYVYPDFEKLQKQQPKLAKMLEQHQWYTITLKDDAHIYEVVLGWPEREAQQPLIESITDTLTQQNEKGSSLDLSDFPGLATLLKVAFVHQHRVEEGTALSALAEIIAEASNSWDYCAILVPERSDDGDDKDKWLHIKECSSNFPSHLKDRRVGKGRFLSGWCYSYRQELTIEDPVEEDPRIAFYGDEHPTAAAAVPAITKEEDGEQKVVGVVYVARRQTLPENASVFSRESITALKALGYICGDIIARDQLEAGTIQGMTRLCAPPLNPLPPFQDLEGLLQRVTDVVKEGVNAEDAPDSWIYLLTLDVHTPPKKDPSSVKVTQWICKNAAKVVNEFLANQLWDFSRRDSLPIGQCEIAPGQFVFAILRAIDLPEEKYKKRMLSLGEELSHMKLRLLTPKFYLWGVTFRYEQLRRDIDNQQLSLADFAQITRNALAANPFINRGHEALSKANFDQAVYHFSYASRIAPKNWYVHKHLAEAWMLKGDFNRAIEQCQIALGLNDRYASAYCLLGDCLSYQCKYGAAMVAYERTLKYNSSRPDFLTRYGIALANMTRPQYQMARDELAQQEPDLDQQRFHDEPYLEAIDKFDQALTLSEGLGAIIEEQPVEVRRAEYHYQRGYAYLRAGQLDKAIEDFESGRRSTPNDLRLLQAYAYAKSLKNERQKDDLPSVEERSGEDSVTNL